MKRGMQVGLGPGHIVLDVDPSPPKRDTALIFGQCCGQTAGWINMSLGREVGLGTGDIVLDGDPAPPPKGHSPPPINGCIDQDATW